MHARTNVVVRLEDSSDTRKKKKRRRSLLRFFFRRCISSVMVIIFLSFFGKYVLTHAEWSFSPSLFFCKKSSLKGGVSRLDDP